MKRSFTPKEHQRAAIEWVLGHERCCLFLEMGLGKTAVTLTAIQRLKDDLDVERVLVVAPKKVADTTWQDEAAQWAHLSLTVSTVAGTPKQRLRALDRDADVYVIGRDSLAWLTEQASAPRFDMLVVDELTSFKNHRATRTKAALRLSRAARRVVGLTGTPTPQGLADLWAQMLVVDLGERLGTSLTRYRKTYFDIFERNHIIIRQTPRPGAQEVIEELIADISLTMLGDEHNPLPPLTVEDVEVPLDDERMGAYRAFERERVLELMSEAGGDATAITAANAAVVMGKLAQYTGGAIYDEERGVHVVGDEKMAALRRCVEESDGPVMVFYQYRHEMERILREIDGARAYGGADDLRAWNRGEVPVLVCHPASTAYGLNLQYGGHEMVWYGTGWSLELYEQAVARLHRTGQQHAVRCRRLICPGTVDERMRDAIDHKRRGQRALMRALADMVVANAGQEVMDRQQQLTSHIHT